MDCDQFSFVEEMGPSFFSWLTHSHFTSRYYCLLLADTWPLHFQVLLFSPDWHMAISLPGITVFPWLRHGHFTSRYYCFLLADTRPFQFQVLLFSPDWHMVTSLPRVIVVCLNFKHFCGTGNVGEDRSYLMVPLVMTVSGTLWHHWCIQVVRWIMTSLVHRGSHESWHH